MPITIVKLRERILAAKTWPNILEKLFSEEIHNGKLLIDGVDFSLLGSALAGYDFKNCILRNCRFHHQSITSCDFKEADVDRSNQFHDVVFDRSVGGLSKVVPVVMDNKMEKSEKDVKAVTALFAAKWIVKVGDGLLEKYDRADRWRKRVVEVYRNEMSCYDNIQCFGFADFWAKTRDDCAFQFRHPLAAKAKDHRGWKLHISVDSKDLIKAFNAIAHILIKYKVIFKVADAKQNFLSKQFTVYLSDSGISEVDTMAMMHEVSQQLVQQNIGVGDIPVSDRLTLWAHCSIRNDQMGVAGYLEYIPAQLVGANFNPSNFSNPYSKLLKTPSPAFDLLAHFNLFQASDHLAARGVALYFCILAFLREYTHLDQIKFSLDDSLLFAGNEFDGLVPNQRFSEVKEIDKETISFCCKMISCLLNKPDHTVFDQWAFSQYYPRDDAFKKALVVMEEKANCDLKLTEQAGYVKKIPFKDMWTKWEEKVANKIFSNLDAQLEMQEDAKIPAHTKWLKLLHQSNPFVVDRIVCRLEGCHPLCVNTEVTANDLKLHDDFIQRLKVINTPQINSILADIYKKAKLLAPGMHHLQLAIVHEKNDFNRYQTYRHAIHLFDTNPVEFLAFLEGLIKQGLHVYSLELAGALSQATSEHQGLPYSSIPKDIPRAIQILEEYKKQHPAHEEAVDEMLVDIQRSVPRPK